LIVRFTPWLCLQMVLSPMRMGVFFAIAHWAQSEKPAIQKHILESTGTTTS
jgi:hypothetical protein